MNAKKIMGAVLVALLALTAFAGAGAAVANGDTVFVYENVSGLTGTWTYGANTIVATPSGDKGYFGGDKIVEGPYKGKVSGTEITIYVKYPTAVITGIAEETYIFTGSVLYTGDDAVIDVVSANTNVPANNVLYTFANGTAVVMTEGEASANLTNGGVGEYKIQPIFDKSKFITGVPEQYLVGAPVIIKKAEASDATISASVNTVLKGDVVALTVTGKPADTYQFKFDEYAFSAQVGQLYLDTQNDTTVNFTMPNTGSVTLTLKSNATGVDNKETITVYHLENSKFVKTDANVAINFEKGTISAKTEAASYFVGDKVKVTGTSTAGDIAFVNISGTNFKADEIIAVNSITTEGDSPMTFEFNIDTKLINDDLKRLDVGTYTLTIQTASGEKATVALVLKQPFVSIIEAPEVVAQNTDAEFIINAEAASKVKAYVFGTNYFNKFDGKQDDDIKNQFTITIDEKETVKMDAGQYFMVIQHPMYDEIYNILPVSKDFYLNTKTEPVAENTAGNQYLFSVNIRQTANAAQALCDALDSQNIDDMYVKYSFFVVGENDSFSINDIPTQVVKGDKIVISGVDTANDGEDVVVEMISTAFAAVPKETVGSAAFIVVTTKIADDGTWEVTLDTSDLNVDEYSLSVAIKDVTKKNVNINVVEGADEPVNPEQPEEPGQDEPEEPVAPATPGFGALAALAGLGAVAVLLLRRE